MYHKGVNSTTYSLNDLCRLSALPVRTVRYYIQIGLLNKPLGEKRGAYYTQHHLDQLLRIVELSQAGVSLDRIRQVLQGADAPVGPATRKLGAVQVRSHICLGPGLELQVTPEEARLSPAQLRAFIAAVTQAIQDIQDANND